MTILLNPGTADRNQLRDLYGRAFREASELYIASAYLTSWDAEQRLTSSCKRLVFVVGTDFGLTRTSALRAVLKWLPKRGSVLFGAVAGDGAGGFHPKVLLWKTATGSRYAIVGSSNLSKAAFDSNYEANMFTRVSAAEYQRVARWVDSIAGRSAAINEDWIGNHYHEAKRPPGLKGLPTLTPIVTLRLPKGSRYASRVRERRKAQSTFAEISTPIRKAARLCADKRMSNSIFWSTFWGLWSAHESRFQGKGLEIWCKGRTGNRPAPPVLRILGAAKNQAGPELDHIVSLEIDLLHRYKNPARGAWLSEMLCHFLPNQYPVLNGPIKDWLKANRWRPRRGATEGQRYTELAQQLRLALREKPAGAANLAELDLAIWQWVQDEL